MPAPPPGLQLAAYGALPRLGVRVLGSTRRPCWACRLVSGLAGSRPTLPCRRRRHGSDAGIRPVKRLDLVVCCLRTLLPSTRPPAGSASEPRRDEVTLTATSCTTGQGRTCGQETCEWIGSQPSIGNSPGRQTIADRGMARELRIRDLNSVIGGALNFRQQARLCG